MKKFTINRLTLMITLFTLFSITQAKEESDRNEHNHHTTKPAKTKTFTPDKAFGGDAAQGKYIRKEQIATIIDGDTTYSFTQIEPTPNPSGPTKNKLSENLIEIGSFSTHNPKKPEMPRTTYLFGIETVAKTTEPSSQSSDTQQQERPIMGRSSATWAPRTFQPLGQFADDGLVGNYFSSSQTATIHDPSGQNKQAYTFNNVQPDETQTPEGLVKIGSWLESPKCDGICPTVMKKVNLYGQLVENKN